MAEPIPVAPADTHEIVSDLDTIAHAIGSLATKIGREMDPGRRADALKQMGIISVAARALYEGLGCSETGVQNPGASSYRTLHSLPAHTQEVDTGFAQDANQTEDPAMQAAQPQAVPVGAPEYLTLQQRREQKILAALREAGETGLTGAELGVMLDEPGLAAPARRMAVSRCLASLASTGYAIATHTGNSRYRRYRLPQSLVAQAVTIPKKRVGDLSQADVGVTDDMAETTSRKKLTRWGLEQRGEQFFINDRSVMLSTLAIRCLRLLIDNPAGLSRNSLRRTLQEQEHSAGTGVSYSEEDIRHALGEIREQVENGRESPRIYEQHVTHSGGHVKLLRLAGLVAA